MSSITIRKLDPEVKALLRQRAAVNGHSMEEEARRILSLAVAPDPNPPQSAFDALRPAFEELGGIELDLPPRHTPREAPDLTS